MRFYLEDTEVQVEINPQLVKAKDTTNDSFSCVLKANTQRTPIKPMTPFTIDDGTNQRVYWIINDSVSVFSLNPASYKHSLTLVQYRYFLNKHLVRNSVFNQPKFRETKIFASISCTRTYNSTYGVRYQLSGGEDGIPVFEYWSDVASINEHSRIKNLKVEMKLYAIYGNTQTLLRLYNLPSSDNVQINADMVFYLVDSNNNNARVTSDFDLSDFNRELNSDIHKAEIQAYLNTHSNVKLVFMYDSGTGQTRDRYEWAFLEPADPEDTDTNTIKVGTFQIELTMEIVNYNMYDILETLLDQYKLESVGFPNKREQLFYLPTDPNDDLYKLLKSTYPPDTMSFTQATWYEVLTEIFRFFDAGFYFDSDKYIHIEYYNDRNRQLTQKETGVALTHSEKNYNSGRVAYYQNAIQKLSLKRINTRIKTLGVPGESDYGIVLEKPIYDIKKLSVICSGSFTYTSEAGTQSLSVIGTTDKIEIDITPFVIEDSVWTTLPATKTISGIFTHENYQSTRLRYQRGGNFIGLSELTQNYTSTTYKNFEPVLKSGFARFFGLTRPFRLTSNFAVPTATSYLNQLFNIEYLTNANGRTEIQTVEKQYNGQVIANQSNGGADLNKLGASIFTESLKDGVPTLTSSWIIEDWEDRPVEGDYIVVDGETWIANVINYTILPNNKEKCTIEFSKNFNLLNLRVESDNQKRLTNISRDLALVSEDTFMDFVYITNDISELSDYPSSNIVISSFDSFILKTLQYQAANAYADKDFDIAAISTYSSNGQTYTSNIQIPFIKYGAGNTINFEMQFNDPINAGNQIITAENDSWYATSYFSKATPYTDDEGWADMIDIKFYSITEFGRKNGVGSYPKLSLTTGAYNNVELMGSIPALKFYKKPNEIFALNYQLCFLPTPTKINELFIGTKFINENALVDFELIKNKKFYLKYTSVNDSHRYVIMDTKGVGTTVEDITFSLVQLPTRRALAVTLSYDDFECGTWAIVDENNDIYFASNKGVHFGTEPTEILYFIPSNHRL